MGDEVSSSSSEETIRFVKLKFYRRTDAKVPYKTKTLELNSGSYWKLNTKLSSEPQPITLSYIDCAGDVCVIDDADTFDVALKTGPGSENDTYDTLNIRVDHYQIEL